MFATRAALRQMSSQRYGRIACVTSVSPYVGQEMVDAYNASKMGIEGYIKGVARRYADRSITLNCIAFGAVYTDIILKPDEQMKGKLISHYIEQTPMGRVGTVEEAADMILFYVSDMPSFVTGQVIHANGGLYMA